MDLLNYPYIIKKLKICWEKSKGDECKLSQREANLLCEGTNIDVANKISNYMNMLMTCLFYSPIVPHTIPLAMVSSFLTYWTTKYNLLRKHKMPDMFSELMATFFANILPILVLVWSISFWYFVHKCKELTTKKIELINE
jgi:hypothetical protein